MQHLQPFPPQSVQDRVKKIFSSGRAGFLQRKQANPNHNILELSNWPKVICPTYTPPSNDQDVGYRLYKESQDLLFIKVGKGWAAKRFKVHKRLICYYSEYFQKACHSTFAESFSDRFDLNEDNPIAFSLFVEWLYSPLKSPQEYRPDYRSLSSWATNAEEAWVLADKLLTTEFGKFALSQVIQHVDVAGTNKKLAYVFEHTLSESPIQCFCSHWIAWTLHSEGTQANNYRKLLARTLKTEARTTATDPRQYHLLHWYSDCGKSIAPLCSHYVTRYGGYNVLISTPLPRRFQKLEYPSLCLAILSYPILAFAIFSLTIVLLVSPYGDAIDRSGIIYGIVFSVHALLNLGAAVLRRGDLSPFGIYLIYLISFFPYTSIAYGVVTAIYSSHCWQSQGNPPYSICIAVTSLTVLVWTSIPILFIWFPAVLWWKDIRTEQKHHENC